MSVASTPTVRWLALLFGGWVNRRQLEVIAYLQEENRILKQRLGVRRLRFTDAERGRLARKAHALGYKLLQTLETLVTPDTLMRCKVDFSSVTFVQPAAAGIRLRVSSPASIRGE